MYICRKVKKYRFVCEKWDFMVVISNFIKIFVFFTLLLELLGTKCTETASFNNSFFS